MRKFLISVLVASSALAAAAPAAAADRAFDRRHASNFHDGSDIQMRLNQIERRIHNAAARRVISQREASTLLRQANRIDRDFDRARRNGLSQREHHMLQQQVAQLQQNLRFERRDFDNRRG